MALSVAMLVLVAASTEEYAFPYLTLRSGIAAYRTYLRWAQKVLEQLRERQSATRSGE